MITRRSCVERGVVAALLATTGLPASTQPTMAAASTPALGDRVTWPTIRLLDGRAAPQPGPGDAASIVVFFSTSCPFCARHNDHVQALAERSRGLPLRVLAIAHDTLESHVRTYMRRRGLAFDVSMDHATMRPALTKLRGVPITCVVDRQQRLREVIRGEMFEADVLALIKWAGTG